MWNIDLDTSKSIMPYNIYQPVPFHLSNFARIASFVGFLCVTYKGLFSISKRGKFIDLYAPIVYVSLAWTALMFSFLFHQSYTHVCVLIGRIKLAKKNGGKERVEEHKVKSGFYNDYEVIIVNTTVRNTIEQSIIFLPLLWLCAVSGEEESIVRAKYLGWLWVLTRAYYPLVYGKFLETKNRPTLFLSTVIGYAAQTGLAWQILLALNAV